MKVIIETGRQIPPSPKARKYAFLDKLEVGQNVLLENEDDAIRVRDAMRFRGMANATRKSREGWRIWYTGPMKPKRRA